MSEKKGKVPALVCAVGGAPLGWHTVDGVGLVHPEIPVPHHNAEQFVKAFEDRNGELKKAWDRHEKEMEQAEPPLRVHGRLPFVPPPCPVQLVHITQAEADKGLEAHEQARQEALGNLRASRRSSDDVERTLAHNETAALAGGEE